MEEEEQHLLGLVCLFALSTRGFLLVAEVLVGLATDTTVY